MSPGRGPDPFPPRPVEAHCKRKRPVNLSITHISGQAEAEMNVGQPGHAAPEDHVAGWSVSRSVQIAAETGQSCQIIADGLLV